MQSQKNQLFLKSSDLMTDWRNEIKFFTSIEEAKRLDQTLSRFLRPDQHSTNGEYFVTSLYLEGLNSDENFQKLSGDYERRKYRLRSYNRNVADIVSYKLERKARRGTLINKTSKTLKALWPNNNFDLLKIKSDELFINEFKSDFLRQNLQPSVLVSYYRKAYALSSRARITIDYSLRAEASRNYKNVLARTPVTNVDWSIVEVKYPSNMAPSFVWDILESFNLKRTSSSKFLMAKRLTPFQIWEDQ